MVIVPKSGRILNVMELRRSVSTPQPTATWMPIPHYDFVELVRNELSEHGILVDEEEHGVTKYGDRYFGIFVLKVNSLDLLATSPPIAEARTRLLCGLRNSHDKSFASGICWGAEVMVCSNLSFTGEIVVSRKHTRLIREGLAEKIASVVGGVVQYGLAQKERFEAYEKHQIFQDESKEIDYLIMESWRKKVISCSQIAAVHDEWIRPSFSVFRKSRSMWGLFNAFTTVMSKKVATSDLSVRTSILQEKILDPYVSQTSMAGA